MVVTSSIFGTDGIRGRFGSFPLTPDVLTTLARAIASFLYAQNKNPLPILIARDTRISGPDIEQHMITTFNTCGINTVSLGVVPTPALVYAMHTGEACLGMMISASHNPWHDNGIKLFDATGRKLTPTQEAALETFMTSEAVTHKPAGTHGHQDVIPSYKAFIKQTVNPLSLTGQRLVIDTAHGAFTHIAPAVFKDLGADVITIGHDPNGKNINDDCGTTHPCTLQESVKKHHASFGVAFDGDGDRVLLCHDDGTLLDGDQILALLALTHQAQGRLDPPIVVSTVMANQAMEDCLTENGITLLRTPVGDRFIAETMAKTGSLLGGEASGHMILGQHSFTGDGLLAALHTLKVLMDPESPRMAFTPYPHHLENLPMAQMDPKILANLDAIQQAMTKTLRKGERFLLRKSGTEPLVRVMIEAPSQEKISAIKTRAMEHLMGLASTTAL